MLFFKQVMICLVATFAFVGCALDTPKPESIVAFIDVTPAQAEAGEPDEMAGDHGATESDNAHRIDIIDERPRDTSEDKDAIEITATFPFVVDTADGPIFPSYLAHLMGREVELAAFESMELACAVIENRGEDPIDVIVESQLMGYSTLGRQALTIQPDRVERVCPSVTPDFERLNTLLEPIDSIVALTVTNNTNRVILQMDEQMVTIPPTNEMFWYLGASASLETVAVFSRPRDPSIHQIMDDIVEQAQFPVGSGGYRAAPGRFLPERSETLQPKDFVVYPIILEAGESINFEFDSEGQGVSIWLVTTSADENGQDDEYNIVQEWQQVNGLTKAEFTSDAFDTYHLLIYNRSETDERQATIRRSMTRADDVFDYLTTIFDYLRAQDINYVSLHESQLLGAQNIVPADAMLENGGGNCIDGSLLFASILEAFGLKPYIVLVPGHAFVAVHSGGTPGMIYPLETTLVGTVASAFDAIDAGIRQLEGQLDFIDISALRARGITPQPL